MIRNFIFDSIKIAINLILILSIIVIQIYLIFGSGKKYMVYRMRNYWFKFIIRLNTNLAACFVKVLKIFFVEMIGGIKNLKIFLWKLYYYKNGIEKLSFDSFCKGV